MDFNYIEYSTDINECLLWYMILFAKKGEMHISEVRS